MKKIMSYILLIIAIIFSYKLYANNEKILKENDTKTSKVSYYGGNFHGRKTSSGEIFNKNKMTAASNIYPLGTNLVVWRIKDGDTLKVKVTVNDRMGISTGKKRALDLSEAAMKQLKGIKSGIIIVNIDLDVEPSAKSVL